VTDPEEARARRRIMRIAFAVLGVVSFVALVAMIGAGTVKVHSGSGLDTYRTAWLVEFNWVWFLVLVVAFLVAVVGSGILRYIERRAQHQ
jgi:uncharacterized membrane protein